MLATLESLLGLVAAIVALETEHDLLGGLSLLVEHGLSLTTKAGLFAIITTLSYNSACQHSEVRLSSII